LIGKGTSDVLSTADATSFEAKDRDALAAALVVDTNEQIEAGNGDRRTLHTRRLTLLDADNQPQYLLGISEDVTDRHAAELAVAQAKDEAVRANGAKSEFLSRMSHELRTPLNAILGFAQLLEMDQLAPDQKDSVDQILRGGRHLLALINEVLDISRIETGSLALSTEPVDISEIFDETVSLIRSIAKERDITLSVEALDPAARVAQADRQRLKQILINLASNAVKYNRYGGRVSFSCKPGSPGCLRIEVTDTGIGLNADQLARLFVPFDRLGAELTEVEGTGIGLALTRRLAEAMGGRVEAASTPGTGSTFAVELPLATDPLDRSNEVVAQMPIRRPSETPTGGVLYVEDNPANLRLVERVLAQRGGLSLVTTARGAPALALARRHHPDLILLDVHLPDIDGDAVLFQLLHDPVTAGIPVVMVTADATPGQIHRLMATGAADYLTKPLDIARLLRVLDEFLGVRRS
jgi:signal transduction histidine kinase/CheY-like chemotaxis protein